VPLVGFTIDMYHDARSHEHQSITAVHISFNVFYATGLKMTL